MSSTAPQATLGSAAKPESGNEKKPLTGYVPFPNDLRKKDNAAIQSVTVAMPQRTAVLVIHGIGAQKPYETLDQFARGLLRFFTPTPPPPAPKAKAPPSSERPTPTPPPPALPSPEQDLKLRQHKANPNTAQVDWTQAFIRINPAPDQSQGEIDVYEYYWAPVITDKVSAIQSLKFLIMAGLSPFEYLRDNLMVINRAHPLASKGNRLKWGVYSLLREIFRMLFIFIPLIALCVAAYQLIAVPIADHVFPGTGQSFLLRKFLEHPPLLVREGIILLLTVVRFLLLGSAALFLFQEFFASFDGKRRESSPRIYTFIMIALFGALLVAPHFLPDHPPCFVLFLRHAFLSLSPLVQCLIAFLVTSVLIALTFRSSILRAAWKRAWTASRKHLIVSIILALTVIVGAVSFFHFRPQAFCFLTRVFQLLALPTFIKWPIVLEYALLALLAFLVRKALTTAIGCLVVYLGADALSKNFAARSQILHECTGALIELLSGADETGQPIPEYTYDQVFIAAHSLGSVIAFDALNELVVRNHANPVLGQTIPLHKLKGLLTFGCPLNKVVYFFRTRVNLRTNVLSQILYALHPFRLRTPLPPEANPEKALPHPFPKGMTFARNFRWFNAYSPFDLISGRMQFYCADRDVPVERGVTPWTAHLSYWENPDLYNLFCDLLK